MEADANVDVNAGTVPSSSCVLNSGADCIAFACLVLYRALPMLISLGDKMLCLLAENESVQLVCPEFSRYVSDLVSHVLRFQSRFGLGEIGGAIGNNIFGEEDAFA